MRNMVLIHYFLFPNPFSRRSKLLRYLKLICLLYKPFLVLDPCYLLLAPCFLFLSHATYL